MTNRKWLESLSDEELAGFLSCEVFEHGISIDGEDIYDKPSDWLEWLKEEHDD